MSYASSPPEITSALLHGGPGSGSMVSAAVSWGGLAVELRSAAASFESATSALTFGPWQGAAAVRMTEAAAPYAAYLAAAAVHSEAAAGQATAVAAAFEGARSAAVPSAVIAANRAIAGALARVNFFGFNFPAIAAKESEYEEMWAQDVAAMSAYHTGAAQACSRLQPIQQLLALLPRTTGSPALPREPGSVTPAAAPAPQPGPASPSPSPTTPSTPSTQAPVSPNPRPATPLSPQPVSPAPATRPVPPSTTSPASPTPRPVTPAPARPTVPVKR